MYMCSFLSFGFVNISDLTGLEEITLQLSLCKTKKDTYLNFALYKCNINSLNSLNCVECFIFI